MIDEAGNGDGLVCAHAFPDPVCRHLYVKLGLTECRVETLYKFSDNNSPARLI